MEKISARLYYIYRNWHLNDKFQQEGLRVTTIGDFGPSTTIVLFYEPKALTIDIGFCKLYRSPEALGRNPGSSSCG